VLLVLLTVFGAGYLVLFSPLLGVRTVEVVGVRSLSAGDVRAAAAVPEREPMLRVDLEEIRRRVKQLSLVADVRVDRSWPSTLVVEVTERVPVAVFKAEDGQWLVDATGLAYTPATSEEATGLPELVVPRAVPDDPATAVAVRVLTVLPERVRQELLAVTAHSPHDVRLTLSAGREVRWGGARDAERKAAVLDVLLSRPGKVYDVSAPELPTVA